MATKARIKSTGEFFSDEQINERLPAVTDGLLAFYPCDNAFNMAGFRALEDCNVLAFRRYSTVERCQLFLYIQSKARAFTETTNLLAVSVATALTYDLIVCDDSLLEVSAAKVVKLKEFADAGLAVIATGNDTPSNVLVNVASVPNTAHTLIACNNAFVETKGLQGVAGSGDAVLAVSSFNNANCFPLYRRSDTNHVSGYIYQPPSKGCLYFDHEGFYGAVSSMPAAFLPIFEYVCSRSIAALMSVPSTTPDGFLCQHATTNLLTFGDFKSFAGWWCSDSTPPTRQLLPMAGYDGRNAVRIIKLKNGASTGYFQVYCGFPEAVVAGTTYVASIKYNCALGTTYFRIGDWGGPDGNIPGWPVLYDVALSNGWRMRVCKITYTNAKAAGFTFGVNSLPIDSIVEFCDFQLEKLPHPSVFALGSTAKRYFQLRQVRAIPWTLVFDLLVFHANDYRPTSGTDSNIYIMRTTGTTLIFWKRAAENYYRLRVNNLSASDLVLPMNAIVPGTVQRIAIVTITGKTTLFIDGAEIGSIASAAAISGDIAFNGSDNNGMFLLSNIGLFGRALSMQEIQTVGKGKLSVGSAVTSGLFLERENLRTDGVSSNIYGTGVTISPLWNIYQQAKCLVTAVRASRRQNAFCHLIYREPNVVHGGTNSVMWGGIIVKLQQSEKIVGRTYQVSFWQKGQSSNGQEVYISRNAGWITHAVGFTTILYLGCAHGPNFNSRDWVHFTAQYTVPASRWQRPRFFCNTVAGSSVVTLVGESATYFSTVISYFLTGDLLVANASIPACTILSIDSVNKTFTLSANALATSSSVTTYKSDYYDTFVDLKIGYTYADTGALGTVLFVDDIRIVDVTDESSVPMRTGASGTILHTGEEGINTVYAEGSGYPAGTITLDDTRKLFLNGIDKALTNGRGLCLSVWTDPASVVSTYYDTFGAVGTHTTLATALAALKDSQYWALTSCGAIINPDPGMATALKNQLAAMRMTQLAEVVWSTSTRRSCYAAFGKGQLCWKEDLRGHGNDRFYATISVQF